MTKEIVLDLINKALEARKQSYCPYSHYSVGAALLAKNGCIFKGCNVESAAYGPSNCAERTAFFKAVSEGIKDFQAIAIAGGKADQEISEYFPPCGVCRQVMMEFCDPKEFIIIMANSPQTYKIHTLEEILPMGFGPNNL